MPVDVQLEKAPQSRRDRKRSRLAWQVGSGLSYGFLSGGGSRFGEQAGTCKVVRAVGGLDDAPNAVLGNGNLGHLRACRQGLGHVVVGLGLGVAVDLAGGVNGDLVDGG